MEVEGVKTITVHTIMTEAEARWLMRIMQNPIHANTLEDELTEDRDYRERFFSNLRLLFDDLDNV